MNVRHALFALFVVLAAACAEVGDPGAGEDLERATFALAAYGGLEGWSLDVTIDCEGGYHAEDRAPFLPHGASGETSAHLYFSEIPAGRCELVSLVVDGDGQPIADCLPATAQAVVERGDTALVEIRNACRASAEPGQVVPGGSVCWLSRVGSPIGEDGLDLRRGEPAVVRFDVSGDGAEPYTLDLHTEQAEEAGLVDIAALDRDGFLVACREPVDGPVWLVADLDQCGAVVQAQRFPVFCDPSGRQLYFSESCRHRIVRVGLDGQGLTPVLEGRDAPHDLVLSPDGDTLYWTAWSGPGTEVWRSSLRGGEATLLYEVFGGGQGLAIDWEAGLMFFAGYYAGLYVGSLDGQRPAECILPSYDLGADGVGMGVEVDPARQQVYFFTRDNNSPSGRRIWRAGYDGAGLTELYDPETTDCLAVDLAGGYLYFTDYIAGTHRMWRSALDGSRAEELFALPENGACGGVVVDGDDIYVLIGFGETYGNRSHLWRGHLDGSNMVRLLDDLYGAQGILLR